jgi:hypothetical protein
MGFGPVISEHIGPRGVLPELESGNIWEEMRKL